MPADVRRVAQALLLDVLYLGRRELALRQYVATFFCAFILTRRAELLCPATNSTNVGFANWPLADAGTRASGVCFTGYSGSPTRACLNNGVWDANAITSCNRMLPSALFSAC